MANDSKYIYKILLLCLLALSFLKIIIGGRGGGGGWLLCSYASDGHLYFLTV